MSSSQSYQRLLRSASIEFTEKRVHCPSRDQLALETIGNIKFSHALKITDVLKLIHDRSMHYQLIIKVKEQSKHNAKLILDDLNIFLQMLLDDKKIALLESYDIRLNSYESCIANYGKIPGELWASRFSEFVTINNVDDLITVLQKLPEKHMMRADLAIAYGHVIKSDDPCYILQKILNIIDLLGGPEEISATHFINKHDRFNFNTFLTALERLPDNLKLNAVVTHKHLFEIPNDFFFRYDPNKLPQVLTLLPPESQINFIYKMQRQFLDWRDYGPSDLIKYFSTLINRVITENTDGSVPFFL